MTRAERLAAAFDAAFRNHAPRHDVRAETAEDHAFLLALFGAVSPMHGMMPPFMLDQQAKAANAHFRAAFPGAMHRIATWNGEPVCRFIVDWTPADHAMGVDIAALPGTQARWVGLAMLRAWVAVADEAILPCRLTVVATNRARHIYTRLGFVAEPGDPADPMITMVRRAAG